MDNPPQTSHTKPWTRRDCMMLGAKWAALYAMLATLPVVCLVVLRNLIEQPSGNISQLQLILQSQLVVLPPAAAIGALLGLNLYRKTTGSAKHGNDEYIFWIYLSFLFSWLVILLIFHRLHREKVRGGENPSWALPIWYFLINAFLAFLAMAVPEPGERIDLQTMILITVLLAAHSVFFSDSLLVIEFCKLRDAGSLATPDVHNIQFSLATMLCCTLGLGAWITALIKIFRK